jgi:hypothetical protein
VAGTTPQASSTYGVCCWLFSCVDVHVHIRRLFMQRAKALALAASEKTETHAIMCVSAECGHPRVMALNCCMTCYYSTTHWFHAGTVRRYRARKRSSGMSACLHPLPRPLQNHTYRCKCACSVLFLLLVHPAEGLRRCAISLSNTLHARARAHTHTHVKDCGNALPPKAALRLYASSRERRILRLFCTGTCLKFWLN